MYLTATHALWFLLVLVGCGGLKENVPRRLTYLNTCSPAGGSVLGGYGTQTTEVDHRELVSTCVKVYQAIARFPSPRKSQPPQAQSFSSLHDATLPLETMNFNLSPSPN